VAKSSPGKPRHSATVDSEAVSIVYTNRYHWGKGIPVWMVASRFKHRGKEWAATAWVDYQYGIKESSGEDWSYQLYGDEFEYYSTPYSYAISDELKFGLEGE